MEPEISTRASGCTNTSSNDEVLQPSYFVPESFFVLKGKGASKGNWIFTCQRCYFKDFSASYKSRVNLRLHVKSKHNGALETFDRLCKENDSRKRKKGPENTSAVASTSKYQDVMKPGTLTQKQFDLYITKYIVESVLPFHHVDSTAFHDFMKALAPRLRVKSHKVYAAKSNDLFQTLRSDLQAKLALAENVCLTIDHWASYRKGYVGFTVHWYTDDLTRKHACLALRRMTGRCTFDALAKIIESVIAEFHLTGKVTHCVTDSGSNFVKAFTEFGSAADEELGLTYEDETLHVTQISNIMSNEEEDEKEYDLPAHMKCAAHKISLTATKDASSALSDAKYKKVYRSLMGKLSAIWNKQSESVLASDKIRKALGKLFVVPNQTRWNSTFDALEKVRDLLHQNKPELATLFISLDLRPIADNEQIFVEEFVSVMKPLAYALDILQGEHTVCAGYLLPTLISIQEEWKILSNAELVYCKILLECLKSGLCTRFEMELQSPYFKVAAALHPKFRLYWVSEDEQGDVVSHVYKALSAFEKKESSTSTNNSIGTKESATHSFFWRFEKRAKMNEKSNSSSLQSKWMDWLKTANDLPKELYKPFAKFNTTLPSSAAVERIFSLGKRVMSPNRTLMSDATFEANVMLASQASKKAQAFIRDVPIPHFYLCFPKIN